jgi:hypothetical protein
MIESPGCVVAQSVDLLPERKELSPRNVLLRGLNTEAYGKCHHVDGSNVLLQPSGSKVYLGQHSFGSAPRAFRIEYEDWFGALLARIPVITHSARDE